MLLGANLVAAFLALALPFALFVSRHVVRSQRAAYYNDIVAILFPDGGGESWPQLETVRTKYATGQEGARGGAHFVSDANRDPRSLVLTALFFAALSFMGFALLLVPPAACGTSALCGHPLQLSFLADIPFWGTAGDEAPKPKQVQLVAAFGFLGAYVTAAQYLIRQLLNYELGAIAFLRATFQIFLGVVVAVMAYRALAPVLGDLSRPFGGKVDEVGAASWWLGAAFMVGLAPEAGLSWISDQLKLRLRKRVNLESLNSALIAPLEVIDGIDSGIRFRLEEANIYDVQNLATQNPVELCVDTPYSLLEIFDWVLQAQLCTVVGGRAFESLRAHNIRTILDLERAVLADDAPQDYVLAIGEVLFANASKEFKSRVGLNGADVALTVDVIQHSVGVVLDDLHVYRLRSLWRTILQRITTEEDRTWLYRRGVLPGDQEALPPLRLNDGIQWRDHAAFLGRHHAKAKEKLNEAEAAASPDPNEVDAAKATVKGFRDATLDAVRRAMKESPLHWAVLRLMWEPLPNKPRARNDLITLRNDADFEAIFNPGPKDPPATGPSRARRSPPAPPPGGRSARGRASS